MNIKPDPNGKITLLNSYYDLFSPNEVRYREEAFVSGSANFGDDWGSHPNRLARYAVLWSLYEGTTYSAVQRFKSGLLKQHDLYEWTKSIGDRCKQVGDFAANYTYGGDLDLNAGDGSVVVSACPILTENENIRPVIGQIWRDSVWQVNKSIYARNATIHGDGFLHAVDQPPILDDDGNVIKAGKAFFVVRDAATVYNLEKDVRGNVRAYVIVEERDDPRYSDRSPLGLTRTCKYVERCWHGEGNTVCYQTYLDRQPFDWVRGLPGDDPEAMSYWEQEYGFVPLVHLQNEDVGKGWGWSAYQGSLDKIFSINDVMSKVVDQVRKIVDAYFFGAGIEQSDLTVSGTDGDKNDLGMLLCGNKDAKIQAMIANLDFSHLAEFLQYFDGQIVQNFPELVAEDVSPNASGEARKVAREKVESLYRAKQAKYDACLVMIHKMCMSIGALQGYPGFLGLSPDGYDLGEFDHTIGGRPVFVVSEEEKISRAVQRASIVSQLVDKGGVPLAIAMEIAEIPKDVIKRAVAMAAKQEAERAKSDAEMQAKTNIDDTESEQSTPSTPSSDA